MSRARVARCSGPLAVALALTVAVTAATLVPAAPEARAEVAAEAETEARPGGSPARDRDPEGPAAGRGGTALERGEAPGDDGAAADPDDVADLEEMLRELEVTREEARDLALELGGVRDEILDAELELAAIAVDLEEARGRLRAAEGQVALGTAALEEAETEQRVAERDHDRAVRQLERAERRLRDEEELLVQQIVRTFKYGTTGAARGAMVIEALRRADDPNTFAVGMKQLRSVVGDQDETVTRVFELREERTRLADEAAGARARAVEAARGAAATLRTLEDLRGREEALADRIAEEEARQTELLEELEGSASETEELLERVADREELLREELAERRARQEARLAEEAARLGIDDLGAALAVPVGGIVCPVVGAVANRDFSNDWGYPRSGGRSHQGNDIFAARGTPIVAVADGVVTRLNPPSAPTGLGGVTVTYRTEDGSEWYNAHLHTIAEDIEVGAEVRQGEPIGTVGNTGNARTTPPHLHLGRRLEGQWINPWPTVSPACR